MPRNPERAPYLHKLDVAKLRRAIFTQIHARAAHGMSERVEQQHVRAANSGWRCASNSHRLGAGNFVLGVPNLVSGTGLGPRAPPPCPPTNPFMTSSTERNSLKNAMLCPAPSWDQRLYVVLFDRAEQIAHEHVLIRHLERFGRVLGLPLLAPRSAHLAKRLARFRSGDDRVGAFPQPATWRRWQGGDAARARESTSRQSPSRPPARPWRAPPRCGVRSRRPRQRAPAPPRRRPRSAAPNENVPIGPVCAPAS